MTDFVHHPSFICPITQSVMGDPVCDREGNTYERAAIEAWVAARGTSPITRTPLTLADLFPNRSLRTAIEDYVGTLTAEQIAQIRPDAADAICVTFAFPVAHREYNARETSRKYTDRTAVATSWMGS